MPHPHEWPSTRVLRALQLLTTDYEPILNALAQSDSPQLGSTMAPGPAAQEGLLHDCPAAPLKADAHDQTAEATAEDGDPAQPGGGVPQAPGAGNHGMPPPILRDHLRLADCDIYREQARPGAGGRDA